MGRAGSTISKMTNTTMSIVVLLINPTFLAKTKEPITRNQIFLIISGTVII